MDLLQMIRELRERQKHLDRVIAALERLKRINSGRHGFAKPEPKRRGRKFMNARERREVSERMKRYWSSRKAQKSTGKKPESGPPSVL
jgi:hypothetical protein